MEAEVKRFWGVVAGLAGLAGMALASWETKGFSVHFNEYEPDFGKPTTPIWMHGWESWDGRSGFVYSSNKSDYDGYPSDYWDITDWAKHRGDAVSKEESRLSSLARVAEAKGQWTSALRQWRAIRALEGPMAALAQDRIEVFSELRRGFSAEILKSYLGARDRSEYKWDTDLRRVLQRIAGNSKAGFLRAHAAYAVAALDEDNAPTAEGTTYARVAFDYPKSPRAESALMMAARTKLRERDREE